MSSPVPTTFTNAVWLLITLLLAAGTTATVWLDNWRWAVTGILAALVVFTAGALVYAMLRARQRRRHLEDLAAEWTEKYGGTS